MMKDAEGLYDVVSEIYALNEMAARVSPAWIATMAMQRIGFPRSLHGIGYIGCHLQFRQIAREYCRKHFDPIDESNDQDDLFPETLQKRYPIPVKDGEEPTYVRLELLSESDLAFNVARLRRSAFARLKHADALEAYMNERRHRA